MKINPVTRRMFLRGSGLSLCIPFLPSLVGRGLAANAGGPPVRRLIVLGTRYGWDKNLWFPTDDALASAQPISSRAKAMPLSELADDISPIHHRSTWGNLLDKAMFLDGVDGLYSLGHRTHYQLTGWAHHDVLDVPNESLDVIIRDNADIHDNEPLASLHLAANPGFHDGETMSVVRSGGSSTYLPHISDPAAAHDQIFQNLIEDDSQLEEFERIRQRDLSVIDRVLADYTRTRQSQRLSKNDQARLDAYMEYLREYEISVSNLEPTYCTKPPRPPSSDELPDAVSAHPDRLAAQITNLVGAIKCGVTNIATLFMMPNTPGYSFIPGHDEVNPHGLAHNLDSDGRASALTRQESLGNYFVEQVASLLQQLDVVEDPDTGRTFLDNSLVLWSTDMGSILNHKGARMPIMMFGGKDCLRQGQYVDFRSDKFDYWDHAHFEAPRHEVGISYNRVLESIARAFGLTPEQYEQGPVPGIGDYTVSKYYARLFDSDEAYVDYAFGDTNTALPELFVDGAAP